jgi:hypothetical protein
VTGERLIPVQTTGPADWLTYVADPPAWATQATFAQVPVAAPDGIDPHASGLGPLLRVLAGFRYRPRWRFVLTWTGPADAGFWQWAIVVHTWVEDAYHPGRWAGGQSFCHLPEMRDWDEAAWLRFLHDYVIPRIEQHEMDEWFVYDGARPYDPHKPSQGSGQVSANGSNGSGGSAAGGGAGGGGGAGNTGGASRGSAGGGAGSGYAGGGGASSSAYAWPPR